ncbi:MAG: iron-containing alcohol dehydrogenase, partial [Candidatus Aminicenantes bacterium]|nr:iron-containing alcohol dehydrogenase [Candidatus Aminicenantes bacterium]
MKELKIKARQLLKEFKGDDYLFGIGVLDRLGDLVSPFGKKCLLITNLGDWNRGDLDLVLSVLNKAGIAVEGPVPSAGPNAPREDVIRLGETVRRSMPDSIVVIDGGSGIDAAKAASVLAVLGGDVEDYFGVGKVSERLSAEGKKLIPLVAVQTAASSAAHLTKYSNITDISVSQKKLIVDEAVVPPKALFDYAITRTMPSGFTLDGGFDGIAHCLEVFCGAGPETYDRVAEIAEVGIELVISGIEKAAADGRNLDAREILGLGTDLGGYAIMIGGTNGAHLTSFSLVDVLSHGRACAMMNPYYTVFFGPAIQPQLRMLGRIYDKYGFMTRSFAGLEGRELAVAVAEGMNNLARRVGFPTTLNE